MRADRNDSSLDPESLHPDFQPRRTEVNEQYATAMQAQEAVGGMLVPGQQRRLDITLRQNIDQRIAEAQANVKTLEETKARMEKSGILDMRIDDIQRAMRW